MGIFVSKFLYFVFAVCPETSTKLYVGLQEKYVIIKTFITKERYHWTSVFRYSIFTVNVIRKKLQKYCTVCNRREKNRNRELYYQERNATAGRETEKEIKERTERTEEMNKNMLQKEKNAL